MGRSLEPISCLPYQRYIILPACPLSPCARFLAVLVSSAVRSVRVFGFLLTGFAAASASYVPGQLLPVSCDRYLECVTPHSAGPLAFLRHFFMRLQFGPQLRPSVLGILSPPVTAFFILFFYVFLHLTALSLILGRRRDCLCGGSVHCQTLPYGPSHQCSHRPQLRYVLDFLAPPHSSLLGLCWKIWRGQAF